MVSLTSTGQETGRKGLIQMASWNQSLLTGKDRLFGSKSSLERVFITGFKARLCIHLFYNFGQMTLCPNLGVFKREIGRKIPAIED